MVVYILRLKHGVICEGKTAAQWFENTKKLPEIDAFVKGKSKGGKGIKGEKLMRVGWQREKG